MPRVLIVDDNADLRFAVASVLEVAGFETIEAADGDEVLSSVLEHRADVVVMDIAMQNVDGFQALAALRADNRTCDLPIILTSGRGDHDLYQRADQAGAAAFLAKPWTFDELTSAVNLALEESID